MEIRAYAINEIGGRAAPFVYERTLGSRDVLVKITHRSLARGDIQFIDNAWRDTRFPLVLSHEIVGPTSLAQRSWETMPLASSILFGFSPLASSVKPPTISTRK